MERVILHSDMDNFYASVECLHKPDIRNKAVAVCGNTEKRHGIVMAKNYLAKKYGVKTGDTIWQAQGKCPNIVCVPPSFDKYIQFSKIAREIYQDYSSQVESFGLDENWIDVSGNVGLNQEAQLLANSIRERIKNELGITTSIGVSWNKVFAKLGSDYNKPDGTTMITKANYKCITWPLPVKELLFVGPATTQKLKKYMIYTIGDLAATSPKILKSELGVNGILLWQFANGNDSSPVANAEDMPPVKSIGNSTTMPYDVTDENDIRITMYVLAESVASRLKELGFRCGTIQVGIRNKYLLSFERQAPLQFATNSSEFIQRKAFEIYQRYKPQEAIRSISIRASNLTAEQNRQLSFFDEFMEMEKQEKADRVIDEIRRRFGHFSIQRGIMFLNKDLSDLDPKNEHTIHPIGYLR